jgi:predicted transcriptional regulator
MRSPLSTSRHGTKSREGRGVLCLGRTEPKRMVEDRRYRYGDPKSPFRFSRVWYFVDLDRETKMPDEPPSPTLDIELTTNIVAAFVLRNQIGAAQLPVLISTIHQTLIGLGKPLTEADEERLLAVPIRRSVHRDYVVASNAAGAARCSDGISNRPRIEPDQYRARWNLPRDHPITARSYSERRSSLAKQLGLGRGLRASGEEPEPVASEIPLAPQSESASAAKVSVRRPRPEGRRSLIPRKRPAGVVTTPDCSR